MTPIALTIFMAVSSMSNPYLNQMPQFNDPAINGNPDASPAEPFLTKPPTTWNFTF